MYIVKDGYNDRCNTGMTKTFAIKKSVVKPDNMSDEEFAKTGFNHRLNPSCFVFIKDVYVEQEFDVITDLNQIIPILSKYEYEAVSIRDSQIDGVDGEVCIFREIGYLD